MLDKITISEQDEHVYQFDNFEFVYYKGDSYILGENGYFPVDGLQDFKKIDNDYIVIYEDDKLIINEEDFEKIKNIILNF